MFKFNVSEYLGVLRLIHSYKDFYSFSPFFSASDTQIYLKRCYKNLEQAEQKSYENCYPFIYYLEHAKIYYDQAANSPILIQPILLFYGFVHLIKACLLTKDPKYPENTTVLAHGVTSRKRKKQQYEFLVHDKAILENKALKIHPKFQDLVIAMKSAYIEGIIFVKEKSANNDLLDALSECLFKFKARSISTL